MNKFILFFLVIYIPLQATDLVPFLEFARQVRKGSPTRIESVQKNFEQLPDYSGVDLKSAITLFLKTELADFEEEGASLIPLAGTSLAGHSEDPVFFLKGQDGTLLLVVKAFKDVDQGECNFLPELSAMEFIAKHAELKIEAPVPLALGKAHNNGVWYGLLAQSPIQGLRADSLFESLKTAKGVEREKKMEELEGLFFTLGSSIARLTVTDQKAPLNPKIVERLRKKMAQLGPQFPDHTAEIEQLIADAETQTYSAGYSHHSTHSANVFYLPEQGKIAFIDLAKFHSSIDVEEHPLSFSAYDLVRFLLSFEKNYQSFLTIEEIEHLKSVAVLSYLGNTEDPAAPTLIEILLADAQLKVHLKYSPQNVESLNE